MLRDLQLGTRFPRTHPEEYHPYGSTAWWAGDSEVVSQKRYRYTGMERDEETGLQCHGVRYYAPWLGRWTSADPIGLGDGVNRYAYCHGGPLGGRDETGLARDEDLTGLEAWRAGTPKEPVPNTESLPPDQPWGGSSITAALGLFKATLGGLEADAGMLALAAPEPFVTKALGTVMVVHGSDTVQAGLRQAATGVETPTLTATGFAGGAKELGFSEPAAGVIGAGADLVVGVGPGLALTATRSLTAAGQLVHFTDAASAAKIEASGELVSKSGSYAIREGVPSGMTGADAAKNVAVAIPNVARPAFVRPVPLGPFTGYGYLAGHAYTQPGVLNLTTGAMAATGKNLNQGVFVGGDIFVRGLVAAGDAVDAYFAPPPPSGAK